tara:strand:- start:382 stop:2595 length:2214 start_codon:yes stop_codon:yes gene_type:complete
MRFFLTTFSTIIILNSCTITKHVPKNKHLLIKNNIELIEGKKINNYEVKKILKQKPNKKIFNGLLKFHLGIYNLTDSNKQNFINNYFRKIGEKPVILDYNLTSKSKLQIERYFKNKGYFNSKVDTSTTYNNNKAIVDYKISLGKCYTIKNIIYPEFNIKNITEKQEIKPGHPLNVELLNKEAERITTILQNNGYYNFQKKSLLYLADTLKTDSVTLTFRIDSTKTDLTKKYHIENINIIIDKDTLTLNQENEKFKLSNSQTEIKPKTLKRALVFKPGELYSLKKIQQTKNNLSNLKIFKSINISFSKSETLNLLECNIYLKKQKKMYYRVEAEGTNSSGNYGTSINFKFGNKNTLKGAENFNFKFKGALETRKNLNSNESFFNIWEAGGETSLKIPRLISPILIKNIKSPNTNFSLSFMKQQRPDFTRSIFKTTLFGYNFKSNKNLTHFLNLMEFSYVKMFNESDDFQEEYLSNQLLQNQYSDHLITASSYSIIYNNQKVNKLQNYSFIKGKLEMSGLSTSLLSNIFNFKQDESGNYTLFQNRFTQYLIGEIDLRRYFIVDKENILVFRAYIGAGYAYNNSDQIPAQKQFFGGGTNGVRAWNPFSLGPGSYQNIENSIDYFLGDIKLESNIEYRFPLFKLGTYKMKGAIFADSGNIWYMQERQNQPGSGFNKNFLSEIAIGLGFGLRYDVNLLVLRIDFAAPIRSPYKINDNNWINNPFKQAIEGDLNLNIGIGYPF